MSKLSKLKKVKIVALEGLLVKANVPTELFTKEELRKLCAVFPLGSEPSVDNIKFAYSDYYPEEHGVLIVQRVS